MPFEHQYPYSARLPSFSQMMFAALWPVCSSPFACIHLSPVSLFTCWYMLPSTEHWVTWGLGSCPTNLCIIMQDLKIVSTQIWMNEFIKKFILWVVIAGVPESDYLASSDTLPLTGCETLSKFFNVSKPQFHYPLSGSNTISYFIGLWELNGILFVASVVPSTQYALK